MADAPIPPQNLDAEESVLGAMLISAVAIDAVLEVGIRPADFYRATHGTIFETMVRLYGDGEPVDAITVADKLDADGKLREVGDKQRIHDLAALVPATGNVRHYAAIVQEMAGLRSLIALGEQIQRLGWERPGGLPELIEQTQNWIYDLSFGSRRDRDATPLREALREQFAKIESLYTDGRDVIGVPTGFFWLDKQTAGLQPGNLIVIAGRPSMGKALALDTPALTPTGWKTMADLSVGDEIVGGDGRPDRVTAVFDHAERDLSRVTFADGAEVECCDEHLWLTTTRNERRRGASPTPRPLAEIRSTLWRDDSPTAANHVIPYVQPIQFAEGEALPLDPYWLGLYLGDGDSSQASRLRFHSEDEELRRAFIAALPQDDQGTERFPSERCSFVSVRRVKRNNQASESLLQLRKLGLAALGSREKFVPAEYLMASVKDRISLLQGLCDTDGYVTDPDGSGIEYSTASQRLAEGVLDLVRSLGGRATCRYVTLHSGYYRLNFSFVSAAIVPVRLARKAAKWKGRERSIGRAIVGIAASRRASCRCITVARGTYVVGDYVVTHNTALALGICANVTIRSGLPVALFTLEMNEGEVVQRLLASEGLVESQNLRTGRLGSEEWKSITAAASRLDPAPLLLYESAMLTALELRSKARRLALKVPSLAMIVVDYLQLMTSGSRAENRNQDVSQISRTLKVLASELQVPVVALSQLTRVVEQRHDKRPMLSDLRESGSIEQDADLVMLLYRDDYYNEDDISSDQRGVAEVNIAKHRNGPTGVVRLAFVERHARFSDMPS